MRALAHPARLAILDALAGGDELTATECAQLTGLSPSATAYHLRLLERFELVEPAAPRPDARERPWRAVGWRRPARFDTSTPGGLAAATTVVNALLDQSRRLLMESERAAAAGAVPEGWDDVTSVASADLWLTPEEARAVSGRLDEVLEPYRGRRLTARPPGSRRVRVLRLVAPHPGRPRP